MKSKYEITPATDANRQKVIALKTFSAHIADLCQPPPPPPALKHVHIKISTDIRVLFVYIVKYLLDILPSDLSPPFDGIVSEKN
jgi:hypothetical protein